VRKSERAIRSARLDLQDGDSDGAVNRAYYAMFNAVQSGRVDAGIGGVLGRTETLRLKADYTGTEIDADTASLVLSEAETFVRTVEREFALDLARTATPVESQGVQPPPDPIEEERRQARENWLRLRPQQLEPATDALEKPTAAPAADSRQRDIETEPGLGLDRDLTEDE